MKIYKKTWPKYFELVKDGTKTFDFGHTDPQICMPYGGKVTISSKDKRIVAEF